MMIYGREGGIVHDVHEQHDLKKNSKDHHVSLSKLAQ